MPDSNKKKDMLDNNSSKKANFGGSVSKAQWTVTAADNVPSFNGKLKIKVGGASLQPSDHNNKNSNEKSTDGQEPGGSEQGLTFAFAGKPTYSPSRIEPSCGSGNANGTTVQTKESPRDASNKDSPASQADSGVFSIASSSSPSKGDGATTADGTSPDSPNQARITYSDQSFNRDMQCKCQGSIDCAGIYPHARRA
jgi:hypothetical protein